MRNKPVQTISSACPLCRYCDRRCEVLITIQEVMKLMLSEVDKRVVVYLSRCEKGRDYIARISRNVNLPYMTVRRLLNRLIELHILMVDDYESNQYRYHQLTSFGLELGVLLQRD